MLEEVGIVQGVAVTGGHADADLIDNDVCLINMAADDVVCYGCWCWFPSCCIPTGSIHELLIPSEGWKR